MGDGAAASAPLLLVAELPVRSSPRPPDEGEEGKNTGPTAAAPSVSAAGVVTGEDGLAAAAAAQQGQDARGRPAAQAAANADADGGAPPLLPLPLLPAAPASASPSAAAAAPAAAISAATVTATAATAARTPAATSVGSRSTTSRPAGVAAATSSRPRQIALTASAVTQSLRPLPRWSVSPNASGHAAATAGDGGVGVKRSASTREGRGAQGDRPDAVPQVQAGCTGPPLLPSPLPLLLPLPPSPASPTSVASDDTAAATKSSSPDTASSRAPALTPNVAARAARGLTRRRAR